MHSPAGRVSPAGPRSLSELTIMLAIMLALSCRLDPARYHLLEGRVESRAHASRQLELRADQLARWYTSATSLAQRPRRLTRPLPASPVYSRQSVAPPMRSALAPTRVASTPARLATRLHS